jgi:hypothetical protein
MKSGLNFFLFLVIYFQLNLLPAQSVLTLNGRELSMPADFSCNNISEKYANELYQRDNSAVNSNFLIINSKNNVNLPHELMTKGYMVVSETPNKSKVDIRFMENITEIQRERFLKIMDSTFLTKQSSEYLTLDNIVKIKNPYNWEISNSQVSFVNNTHLAYSVELIGIKKGNISEDFPNIVQYRSFVYLYESKSIGIAYVCATPQLSKFKMLKSKIESSCSLLN